MNNITFRYDEISGGILFINNNTFYLKSKPELGFEFTALIYESETNFAIVNHNNSDRDMTEEEIKSVVKFCNEFYEEVDFNVLAYDEETKLFQGSMLRSIAKEKGYKYLIDVDYPESEVSKWNGEKWEKIEAIIRSDGSLVINPMGVCDACVLFFTQEEWLQHSWPKYTYEMWDFKSETWVDMRDISVMKINAENQIRMNFNRKMYGDTIPDDQSLVEAQKKEAESWEKDNSSSTPIIDTIVNSMNSNGLIKTKKEYIESILEKYSTEKMERLAKCQGELLSWIYKINNTNSMIELDEIMYSFETEMKMPHNWVTPFKYGEE